MNYQTRQKDKKRRDEKILEISDSLPQKRRRMDTSPAIQVEMGSRSIFGGREKKKDESRLLAAEEGRDRGAMTASSRSGSRDPSSAATTGPVTTGNSERVADVDETPVDRIFYNLHQLTTAPSLFSERVVTVLVGPSKTMWRLHENLLSSSSDFFKSAFNSGFKETFEDQLTLPEDDPQAFELFVRWLYTRAMSSPGSTTTNTTSSTPLSFITSQPPIQTWLRLYVLACKLLVAELENICVNAAWRYYNVGTRRPDIRDVQYIYENTPEGSGMRRLLQERLTLGMFRGRQHNPVTAEWREVLNETPDLGFDIVSEISGFNWISGGNVPARSGSEECAFHRHDKGEGCRPG